MFRCKIWDVEWGRGEAGGIGRDLIIRDLVGHVKEILAWWWTIKES